MQTSMLKLMYVYLMFISQMERITLFSQYFAMSCFLTFLTAEKSNNKFISIFMKNDYANTISVTSGNISNTK